MFKLFVCISVVIDEMLSDDGAACRVEGDAF